MILIGRSSRMHAVGLLCALLLAGCATADITVARPKLYGDDQVRKTLDERRQALSTIGTTIQEGAIQEALGIRQAQQNSLALSGQTVSPTTTTTTAPSNPTSSLTLPSAPGVPSGLGLGFQSLLQKAVERDQRLMGLQFLYLGDSEVLDDARRLWLIRFDMSVNSYKEATSFFGFLWGGEPQFAKVGFKVTVSSKKASNDKDEVVDETVHVYHLMPDISTITAQESFIASHLQNLSLAGAGVTGNTLLQGTASSQSALEQGLVALQEQPLEFAIYGYRPESESNFASSARFGFAIGPRRRIEPRGWLNPARWFGNKYDIHYVLEPGPRDLYALVSVPCAAKTLKIISRVNYGVSESKTSSEDLSSPNYFTKGNDESEYKVQQFRYDLPSDPECIKTKIISDKPTSINVMKGIITINTIQEIPGNKVKLTDSKGNPINIADADMVTINSAIITNQEFQIDNATNIKSDNIFTDQIQAAKTSNISLSGGTIRLEGKGGKIKLAKDWVISSAEIEISPSRQKYPSATITMKQDHEVVQLTDFLVERAQEITINNVNNNLITIERSNDGTGQVSGTPSMLTVQPDKIFPSLTNSLLITSKKPLTSEAQVWIGQYAVPSTNIALLGRHQMKVTVPPNDILKGQVKPAQGTGVKSSDLRFAISPQVSTFQIKNQTIIFTPVSNLRNAIKGIDEQSLIVDFNGNGTITQISPPQATLIGTETGGNGTGNMIGLAQLTSLSLSTKFTVRSPDQTQAVDCQGTTTITNPPTIKGKVNATGDLIVFPAAKTGDPRELYFSGRGTFLGEQSIPFPEKGMSVECRDQKNVVFPNNNMKWVDFPSAFAITIFGAGTVTDTGSGKPPKDTNEIELVVVIPGVTSPSSLTKTVTLASGGPPVASLVVDPPVGEPLRDVTVTVNDPSLDFTKATAVKVGGQVTDILGKPKSNQITFRVPLLPNSITMPTEIDIVISLPAPQKDQVIINKFTYLPPTPQKSATTTSATN